MYDDLTTLMRDATDTLVPPSAAASSALRAAAKSRKRRAFLAGTGGVAAVGLVAGAVTQLPLGHGTQIVTVGAEPPAAPSPADFHTPAQGKGESAGTPTGGPAFRSLALPNSLPGFPVSLFDHPAADSYSNGFTGHDGDRVYVGPGDRTISAPDRLWGWDGALNSSLRLEIVERAQVFAPRADGLIQDRQVDGSMQVRGRTALLSHSSDGKYLSLTYGGYSIQASAGGGATVHDMVTAIDAIEGLDRADPAATPTS